MFVITETEHRGSTKRVWKNITKKMEQSGDFVYARAPYAVVSVGPQEASSWRGVLLQEREDVIRFTFVRGEPS